MNSVANRNGVAHPRFTSPDPNIFRIFRIERDGADGLHRLLVKDGPKPRAAVVGFPDAAAGRADKERDFTRGLSCRGEGRDATAHSRRTDVPRTETGNGGGTIGSVLGVRKSAAEKQGRGERKLQRWQSGAG